MKILLVEDTIGEPIRKVLTRWGHEVSLATTGAQARQLLQASGYNLFLVDWVLPDDSGLDLVRRIREQREYRDAAILMISSRSQRDDIMVAIRSGIDGYMAKPFKPTELRVRIDEVWQRRRRNRGPAQQIEIILQNQEPRQQPGPGPLLIFGEGAVSAAELADPDNTGVLEYLATATTVVSAANAFRPDLRLGYYLVGSTGEVTQLLRARDTARRAQLAVVSTDCHGNAVLMARLIHMRGTTDCRICIVCEQASDLTQEQRDELDEYGGLVLDRRELDADRWRDIIEGQIIQRWSLEAPSQLPSGQLSDEERAVLGELERQVAPSRRR